MSTNPEATVVQTATKVHSTMPLPIQDRLHPDTTLKVSFRGKDQSSSSATTETPRFLLGYWGIRGLGAPLRMMLSHARVNHWVMNYDVKESADGWVTDNYREDKAMLRKEYNPLMNLPFLVDTEKQTLHCQTNAIFLLLGRELNMLGSNEQETATCEELLCEIMDLRDAMISFAYTTPCSEEDALNTVVRMRRHFVKLEGFLSKRYDTPEKAVFLVGDSATAPDFHLFEMMDQYLVLRESHLDPKVKEEDEANYPHLLAFHTNFRSLPNHKEFVDANSLSMFQSMPFNAPKAKFGSSTGGSVYVRGQPTPWIGKGIVECIYDEAC